MTERYADMMISINLWLSVCMKSTAVVEEPYTILDELTFDCLAFVVQQLRQQQDRLVVSRQTVRSCSHVALDFCKPVLNLNGL
jgi:hypothetical protein